MDRLAKPGHDWKERAEPGTVCRAGALRTLTRGRHASPRTKAPLTAGEFRQGTSEMRLVEVRP